MVIYGNYSIFKHLNKNYKPWNLIKLKKLFEYLLRGADKNFDLRDECGPIKKFLT